MTVINPNYFTELPWQDLEKRDKIIKSCVDHPIQHGILYNEVVVLWRNYDSLYDCMTACFDAYLWGSTVEQMFDSYCHQHSNKISFIKATKPTVQTPINYDMYGLNLNSRSGKIARMFLMLHPRVYAHTTHGPYVAWSTLWF